MFSIKVKANPIENTNKKIKDMIPGEIGKVITTNCSSYISSNDLVLCTYIGYINLTDNCSGWYKSPSLDENIVAYDAYVEILKDKTIEIKV